MNISKKKRKLSDRTLVDAALMSPAILLMIVFFAVPIVLTVYYSFTNMSLTGSNVQNFRLVGLDNYAHMFKSSKTLISISNTLVFLIGSLAGQSIVGFAIAYLMQNKSSGFRRVIGPCILSGMVMPEIVVALCCKAFFGTNGTANMILTALHLPAVSWLYEHPMAAVVISNIWHGAAFSMMNYQAALDNVPYETKEAARVDGANGPRILLQIVVPCIKDTIATNTMLNTLSTMGVFGLIYAMTGGGPGTSTMTLPIYMYNEAFKSFQLGKGTAIGMLILILGVLCSIVYSKMLGGKEGKK